MTRHMAPLRPAATVLVACTVAALVAKSNTAWLSSPGRLGKGASGRPLTQGRTGRALRATAVQESTDLGDLERFVAPEQRRKGMGIVAFLRALSCGISLYVMAAFFVPAIALCLPVVKRRDPEQRKFTDRLIMAWSQLLTFPFYRTRVYGTEHLPSTDEACVFVANHQSFLDILSSYHLGHPFKWVSKAEILKIPGVGFAMKSTKTLTIKREDRRSQLQAFRDCVSALKAGTSIFVFPEGTRSKDGVLLDFKKGPFAMAKRAKTAIVPITINGTGRVMPSKKEYLLYPTPHGVQVIVHPRVPVEKVASLSDEELSRDVREIIESAMPPSRRRGVFFCTG